MAQQKEKVEDQVATALQELEKLKSRQENLEGEKSRLEALRQKQNEYQRLKREMLEHLQQSVVRLENDEIRSQQRLDLVSTIRQECAGRVEEIASLKEAAWTEDNFQDELNRALAIVQEARTAYNKAQARLEAVVGPEQASSASSSPVIFEEGPRWGAGEKSFAQFSKIGLACSWPFMLVLSGLALLYYVVHIGWL